MRHIQQHTKHTHVHIHVGCVYVSLAHSSGFHVLQRTEKYFKTRQICVVCTGNGTYIYMCICIIYDTAELTTYQHLERTKRLEQRRLEIDEGQGRPNPSRVTIKGNHRQ